MTQREVDWLRRRFGSVASAGTEEGGAYRRSCFRWVSGFQAKAFGGRRVSISGDAWFDRFRRRGGVTESSTFVEREREREKGIIRSLAPYFLGFLWFTQRRTEGRFLGAAKRLEFPPKGVNYSKLP